MSSFLVYMYTHIHMYFLIVCNDLELLKWITQCQLQISQEYLDKVDQPFSRCLKVQLTLNYIISVFTYKYIHACKNGCLITAKINCSS